VGGVGGANVVSSYMKQQFVTESKKHQMLDSVKNKDRKHDSIQRQHYRYERSRSIFLKLSFCLDKFNFIASVYSFSSTSLQSFDSLYYFKLFKLG
jgi:hypothetical protein